LIRGFHNNYYYIKAVAKGIKNFWQEKGRANKLIFSFHSLPQSLIVKGDPYYEECINTSKLVARELKIEKEEYIISFQSKFGFQKWLSPATSAILVNLAKSNVQSVEVVCPGFVSDCLETLEEIAITNKTLFLEHGGKSYNYIPCLNYKEEFIETLNHLITND
jgi:ferrochelatase